MAIRYLHLLYRVIVFTLLVFISTSARAQFYASSPYRMSSADSLSDKAADKNLIATGEDHGVDKASVKWSNATEKRRLLGYLKALNIPQDEQQAQPNKKFYYHLANVFARLRLYPLAMKFFLKTAQAGHEGDITNQADVDTLGLDTEVLRLSSKDDTVIAQEALVKTNLSLNSKSKPTNSSKIRANFNDGKPTAGYALLFHVKQPVPGKRKIFVWGNTGHTFITLIKYNKDSTYVSASFGFYPRKDQLLSATPLVPTTSSVFRDDAGHQWDEVVGKFISKHKFEKILKLTEDFDGVKYNLNNRNCTDFGLQAAGLAGINITETSGKWPLGKGNNPAITGQSLLTGKLNNTDSSSESALFKYNLVEQ